MRTVEERISAALAADAEELWNLIRDPHPEVVSNALLNRNFSEDMAVFVVKKKTISAEVLGFLAGDVRFKDSFKLKLALCKNPKTPQRITLALLKFMRIFDLADIAKDQQVNINIRQKIEHMIAERIPSMPLGVKTALAKRASTNILISLLDSGDEKVIATCLESPMLTEGNLFRLINRPVTKPEVIRLIAGHGKWSLGYNVRFALIRNFFTPMNAVNKFIGGMKTNDLKELYSDPKIPSSTKPFIFSELLGRGETVDIGQEEVFDLADDDDDHVSETELQGK
ncbi:MAG: hypothetical protein HZA17_13810 [Nitrospirae bacterium]|nr:hypothetical protein [Nitrospirota bacterium]